MDSGDGVTNARNGCLVKILNQYNKIINNFVCDIIMIQ